MICPNCQTPNREIARYCLRCGWWLASRCPFCEKGLDAGAFFCDQCGRQLAVQSDTNTSAVPSNHRDFIPSRPRRHRADVTSPDAARIDLERTATPVDGQSPDPGHPLQPYIPQELLAKLEATQGSGAAVGERRIVTMLFCDVQGSTAAAETLDPEEWTEIINGAFEYMIRPVYTYEGMVARLMGDAILAFFGAPIAHENDPQRAVLAGLEIVNGIKPYREEVGRRWGVEFDVRVGINTGPVVVGPVGSDMRMEYTAMGDAINLAARMEQTAEPGTVQVAAATYQLIAPLFEVEPLGGIEVKGKTEPIQAYRILAPSVQPGRRRGIEGLNSPMVGRDEELVRLRQAMRRAREGNGQIVSVIGEAGIGKSRLLRELRAEWDGGWQAMVAPSVHTGRPYDTFQQQMRSASGISPGDTNAQARQKLGQMLVRSFPHLTAPQPIFEMLLGISRGDGAGIDGETFKREMFAAMQEATRQQIAGQPMVYVLDDVHWMDSASLELENHILELVRENPMLVILSYRPDRETPMWSLREQLRNEHAEHYTEVVLGPLPAAQGSEMIDHLLAPAELPEALRGQILEKADGNPYFIEEIIRSLIDRQHVVRDETRAVWRAASDGVDIDIPGNLQTLLIARIDRLEEDVRRTLQLASVIGRSFYQRVLGLIEEQTLALDERLAELQRMDIIVETAQLPELEYMFRHTMTQEAAYSTLLRRRQRQFHLRVAEALEKLFPNQLEELAPNLARHFFEAQIYDRALVHYTVAGDAAFRLYAHSEAIGHYDKALQSAQESDGEQQQLVHLFTRKGRAQELDNDHRGALTTYDDMLALARQSDDRELELAALIAQGTVRSTATDVRDPALGEKLGQEALVLARALDDKEAEAKIQWNLLNSYRFQNRYDEALEAGERSLVLARELNLHDQLAFTTNDLGYVYLVQGPLERCSEVAHMANELWRELDNLPMLADNLGLLGLMYGLSGRFEAAAAASREGLEIAESIGNLWGQSFSLLGLGYALWAWGDLAQAIETMELCLGLGEEAKFASSGFIAGPWLALVYAGLGARERGLQLAGWAVDLAREHNPFMLPFPTGLLARVQLLAGDVAAAEETLRNMQVSADAVQQYIDFPVEAAYCQLKLAQGEYEPARDLSEAIIQYLREDEMRALLPDFRYYHSQAQLGLGRRDLALENLTQALVEANSIGLRRNLWRILVLLAELKGDEGSRAEARAEIEWLAERTGAPELRQSFLDLPEVRRLLQKNPD